MRRAVVVLGTTAAGLAALFSYKTHVAGIAVASTSPATPAVSASPLASGSGGLLPTSPSPSKTATKKATPKPTPTKPKVTHAAAPATTAASNTPTAAPTTAAPSTPAGKSGTFTGPAENTQYGEVQVSITVSNGKITNANGNLPQGGDNIAQNALPQLNQ